jgi:LmbE family N-acetylglucosaminyl deacetylase
VTPVEKPIPETVLVVAAHPDDVEITCAGTLKRLRQLGTQIHIATMSLGDCGSRAHGRAEIGSIRRKEAEAACVLLGATYHYVGSSDFCIFNDDLHNRAVTALVREVRPSIVLTHSTGDYLLDHDNTSVLSRNACFYAPTPNYDTSKQGEGLPITHIPHLYYFDVVGGTNIFGRPVCPQFYVDIGDVIHFKSEMLACHASQRDWLRAQHGVDNYILSMQLWGAKRGKEASELGERRMVYAECFRQHLGHAYPEDNLLMRLLEEWVVVNPSY